MASNPGRPMLIALAALGMQPTAVPGAFFGVSQRERHSVWQLEQSRLRCEGLDEPLANIPSNPSDKHPK